MTVFDALSPAEQARQLGNPDGEVGLAVAAWLNMTNQPANARMLQSLALKPGDRVLEVGFGNGRVAPLVLAQAPDIRYCGIDISPTMVAEAQAFNAAAIAAGRAEFHLAAAERMPFADAAFDGIFSMGVIHFWAAPAASLAELRRVLRLGGLIRMACLGPRQAPGFARPEFGFHLRDAAEWDRLTRAAGFARVEVETVETELTTPDGQTALRQGIVLTARA